MLPAQQQQQIRKTLVIGMLLLGWLHDIGRALDTDEGNCNGSKDMITLKDCRVSIDSEKYLHALCKMYSAINTSTETLGPRLDIVMVTWGLKSNRPINDSLKHACLVLVNVTLQKSSDERVIETQGIRFDIEKEIQKEYTGLEEANVTFIVQQPRIIGTASFSGPCKEIFLFSSSTSANTSCKLHIEALKEPVLSNNWRKEFPHSSFPNRSVTWFGIYIGQQHTVPLYRIQLRHGFTSAKVVLKFIAQFNVTRLEITKHSFRRIEDDDFPPFSELNVINFRKGDIEFVGRNAFSKLPKLCKVDLSENKLSAIPHAFYLPSRIKELNLEGNSIRDIDTVVNGTSSVSVLRLTNNAIYRIKKGRFSAFTNLTELYLDRCNITVISDGAFEDLISLVVLDLAFNHLESLPEDIFKSLSSLQTLDLSWSNIKSINAEIIVSLHSIEFLNLEGNFLVELIPIGNVRRLNLRNNHIGEWRVPIDYSSHRLVYLDISSNKITVVTTEMHGFLKGIKQVNLSMNPFDCSPCVIPHLLSWLNESNVVVTNRELYYCSYPANLIDQPITRERFNRNECSEEQGSVIIIIAACVLCFMVLFAGCIYYRWYIYFFLKKYKRKVMAPTSSVCNSYRYDAFVGYAASERVWVVTELLPKLEYSDLGLTLCVHDRDFVVGEWITDNIINCINSSRKIMLLLSENFVNSQWCMFEMHLAQHMLFEESRNCVILVKMGDLSDIPLGTYLRYLTKTRTYLEWPSRDESKSLFWERLGRVLRKKNIPIQ